MHELLVKLNFCPLVKSMLHHLEVCDSKTVCSISSMSSYQNTPAIKYKLMILVARKVSLQLLFKYCTYLSFFIPLSALAKNGHEI